MINILKSTDTFVSYQKGWEKSLKNMEEFNNHGATTLPSLRHVSRKREKG
jgi:hypothetical protein